MPHSSNPLFVVRSPQDERRSNAFLSAIHSADLDRLKPHLREMELVKGKMLFDQGGRIDEVIFPVSGIVSFVVAMTDGDQVEAGMIGHDGLIGAGAALNGPRAINRAVVQSPGTALAIPVGALKAALGASETLRGVVYRYDQLLWAQTQQSVACNALHHIEERLCRWILRSRDLVHGDVLHLTQEFIAEMLGVRRTSVTLAARHLQALQLIKYRRGQIDVLDVDGLREASCECYQAFSQQEALILSPAN